MRTIVKYHVSEGFYTLVRFFSESVGEPVTGKVELSFY